MIRLLYWLLAIVEVLLLLVALLLFIITDARTINVLAEEFLPSTEFSYDRIEGNFFTGLEIQNLAYKQKPLFSLAVVHWNPIPLFYKKIALTEVNVQGLEIQSIVDMLDDLKSKSSKSNSSFDFDYSLDHIHVDINPYIYEGVKFSSFLFETEKIEIDKEFMVNTKALYLYFDSDLVNVEVVGAIHDSQLLCERVNLKEISSRDIAQFVKALQAKEKITQKKGDVKRKQTVQVEKKEPFLREIKIKEIYATQKKVTYGPFIIKNANVVIKDAEFDTYNNYTYSANDLKLTGQTNFGKVDFKGIIENSMIDAKGVVTLDKELFERYHLALNYSNLRKLPSQLRLNHQGVWLDIDHQVKALLKLQNSFNLDVQQGKHALYYDYKQRQLTIDSQLKVSMPYGDNIQAENKTVIKGDGTTHYRGSISVPKIKNLPQEIADYLLEGLKARFKGDVSGLVVDLDAKLIEGQFITKGYKNAVMQLKSKERNIVLNKLVPALTLFKDEKLALTSKSYFDFKNSKNSNIHLDIASNLIDINAQMKLLTPYQIILKGNVPQNSSVLKLDKNINTQVFKNIEGEILIHQPNYTIRLNNQNGLVLSLIYNALNKTLNKGVLSLDNEVITFKQEQNQPFMMHSNIKKFEDFSTTLEYYYKTTLPKIQGALDIDFVQEANGLSVFKLQSPQLRYINEDKSFINFNKVQTYFTVDKASNIEVKNYTFALDNQEYIKKFYSDRSSYLTFKDGKLVIKNMWLKNEAFFRGEYDFINSKGDINLVAKKISFENKEFDLLFDLNLKMKMKNKLIDIEGDVDIFGKQIRYDIAGSGITEDPDIIIVQEELKNKESALQNLKLYLKINSKKPLNYYGKDANIEFYNELRVLKNYKSDIMVTGMSTITKGYYQFEDKRFNLNESHLYFAGDPRKPLLDIKADFEKDQYTIHIFISGSAEEPIVNFNSDPYLTQQEILSLILFDGTGSSSGDGAEAYTLLGGTFAKGLIKSLGVDVDHLLLGTDANDDLSLEIGRKISDDITIMYMHEDGKDGAKVRVEHSKNFETDIIIQPPSSSSIEFLYKKDH